MEEIVPLSKPYTDEEEVNAVSEVIRSGRHSLGPKLKEFEEEFAKYIGIKYAAGVSSGTSGLHLCMKILDLKEGDEIITTPFSFIASSNCIIYERTKPVFVDIDEKTFNIDVSKIEDKINNKTKAILPVHVFGHPCNIDEIIEIAERNNLRVVEDACESIGAEYKGIKTGKFGETAVFAFYPNKQITTGEGGMIVTDDEDYYKMIKSLSNQGRSGNGEWLVHDNIGYNYRLNEMSAALGLVQLKKINEILEKRENVAKKYEEILKNIDGVSIPQINNDVKKSWFVYVIRLDDSIDRKIVMDKLNDKGISNNFYFPCIHLQPIYKKMFGYKEGDFPVCEKVSKSTLALPFFTQMDDKTIERVCNSLEEVISKYK